MTSWPLRPGFGSGYVEAGRDTISITLPALFPTRVVLSRADARLLAKRINQCLDQTRKDGPFRHDRRGNWWEKGAVMADDDGGA